MNFTITEPGWDQVMPLIFINIQFSIRRHGNSYLVNGREWWSSEAGDPHCKVAIVIGVTDKILIGK